MRYLVNGLQMKQADQYTIQELGIPSMELMERAALRCVEVMEEEKLDLSSPCIVCGSGNNGGDGFAIARLLAGRNHPAKVCFVGDVSHCTDETRSQMHMLREIGVEICNEFEDGEYSIIIDAIFGVGLSREIQGRYFQIIQRMNETSGIKFAVDMPSGISSDQSNILGIAFKADITVTFQAEKLGLAFYPGKEYAGRVIIADIGISMEKTSVDKQAAYTLEREEYQRILPIRKADSNKGTYGRLLIIAGSKGMSGAAYLNAKAAYMTGAGLVRIYTPEENRMILQQQLPEAIVTAYDHYDKEELLGLLDWADIICIGSGLGLSEQSEKILRITLTHAEVPCLIDADGLNLLAKHREYIDSIKTDIIITPHMKEMSRLVSLSVEELKRGRMEILEEYVKQYHWTCVLKDSRTVVASLDSHPYVNLSGNAAMAKAGSGDVLAGVIAALMAQGLGCHDAAVLGTYLHGRAGDYARAAKGSYSVLARDLIEYLSDALKEIETTGGSQ
ncbi:NAD(P)H-hydrate dehydratase [Bariatricus sp. SGI.154]|uniref:NAD(P)H-hydrate dehydratase n=1 Tax=Bariatricus sp. SGI.154 TaxID=3420549 RepID=UPI003D0465D3